MKLLLSVHLLAFKNLFISKGHGGSVTCVFVLLLISRLGSFGSIYIYKCIIDKLNVIQFNLVVLSYTLIAYLLVKIFGDISNYIANVKFYTLSQFSVKFKSIGWVKHIHNMFFKDYMRLQIGKVSGSVLKGIKALEFLYMAFYINLIPSLIEFLIIISVLFTFINHFYFLIIAPAIIIYFLINIYGTKKQILMRTTVNEHELKANSMLIDSLLNYENIQFFNKQNFITDQYDQVFSLYSASYVLLSKHVAFYSLIKSIFASTFITIIIIISSIEVYDKSISIGDFILINALTFQIFIPISTLSNLYGQIKQSLADLKLIIDINSYPKKEINESKNNSIFKKKSLSLIEFKNVSLELNKKIILRNVNFTIPNKSITAIIGKSGSGKSTLVKLIMHLYEADGGNILIDGQNIKNINQSVLCKLVGVIPQDIILFNNTIAYNIALGNPEITEHEIKNVLKISGLSEVIDRLTDGIYTTVGDRGALFSGGERQRLGIARALVNDPPIIILDEATSALDPYNEKIILDTILAFKGIKTIIIISHKKSLSDLADNVIFLEKENLDNSLW